MANTADSLSAGASEILTDGLTASGVAVPHGVPHANPAEPMWPLLNPLVQAEEADSDPLSI
jgi:hypothetical protein